MNTELIIMIVKLLMGIVVCFAGYRLREFLLPLIWFIICYGLASRYTGYLITDPKVLLVINILIGLIGAFFGYTLEKITINILGFYAGFSIFTNIFGNTSLIGIVGGAILGLVFALLARKLFKFMIILSTAWVGASMITPLVYNYVNIPFQQLYLIIILFVLGALAQFVTSGRDS